MKDVRPCAYQSSPTLCAKGKDVVGLVLLCYLLVASLEHLHLKFRPRLGGITLDDIE